MKYLLDVSALLALAHKAHVHHERAENWFQSIGRAGLCTCAIIELGFVRVSVQTGFQPDVTTACKALAAMKGAAKKPFELLPDDHGADHLPAFAKTPAKLTDGHLLELARHHGAELATFDTRIPGAALIP